MPALINKLYKAGHKPFDLPLERLVASLRVALTAFCLLEFVTVSGLQFQHIAIFEMVLAPYIAFGLGVLLLPTVGKYRTGWQLPVHVIDIGIISIIMYSSQPMLPACFFIVRLCLAQCDVSLELARRTLDNSYIACPSSYNVCHERDD